MQNQCGGDSAVLGTVSLFLHTPPAILFPASTPSETIRRKTSLTKPACVVIVGIWDGDVGLRRQLGVKQLEPNQPTDDQTSVSS